MLLFAQAFAPLLRAEVKLERTARIITLDKHLVHPTSGRRRRPASEAMMTPWFRWAASRKQDRAAAESNLTIDRCALGKSMQVHTANNHERAGGCEVGR